MELTDRELSLREGGCEVLARPKRGLRLSPPRAPRRPAPTLEQARYLRSALGQPGLKLPLFDARGRQVGPRIIDACVVRGWAEPWFDAPRSQGWRVCRLTDRGVQAALQGLSS